MSQAAGDQTDNPDSLRIEEVRIEEVRIEEVRSAKQWRSFHKLREDLYREDAAAPAPLQSMEREKLDPANAFYQHARRTAWICLQGDRCIGRIVAIIDDLHNEYHQDNLGFFGFFECVDNPQAAKRLVDQASLWLREQGCDAMRGPMSPSMKGEMGVLIDGFEHTPTIMMSHARPWYDSLLRSTGLEKIKDVYAFRFFSDAPDHVQKFQKMDQFERRVLDRYPDLRFEQISKSTFSQTVHQVNALGNEVRKVGWGFVPSTTAEIDTMIKNLGSIIRPEAFHVAYYRDEMVGYVISIPDINWALKRTFGKWDWLRKIQLLFWLKRIPKARVIALGAAEQFRNKGIAMLLIKRLIDRRQVFKEWEFSWVLEDNVRSLRAIERSVNLDRYKTWRIYQRPL